MILHTIADSRFSYRRNAIATSMHPVKAAEVVSIASEYLADDADVLDPFCGTATLLIERYRKRKAAHLYGVDIFGEAIDEPEKMQVWRMYRLTLLTRILWSFPIVILLMRY